MIRFGYLTKNDGPAQYAAGDEPSPVSPVRRVLSPFRRRRSIDHSPKLKGKELIAKDPHLGKTVEVTPMEDEDTAEPVIKPSLTYEFEDSSSDESSTLPAPHKAKPQQNQQESSIARLTKSINALLHRSEATSSSGRVPVAAIKVPSKRAKVGRRRSLLGTIGAQGASLTEHITRPRRASMSDAQSHSSSLSSLSSVGSICVSLNSTGRNCGPLDDLLGQEVDEDDNCEELLGNSEHIFLPKSSFPTPRTITINKEGKHHPSNEKQFSIAEESAVSTRGNENAGNTPPALTQLPQSHVEPRRVQQRQRRQATNQRLQRTDCSVASPLASASVLSPTKKKRQPVTGELSKTVAPNSLAALHYPQSPLKLNMSSCSASVASHSVSRQLHPRSPRRRIVSSSGSTVCSARESPLSPSRKSKNPTGQPRLVTQNKTPISPRKDTRPASTRTGGLVMVPDLDVSDEMTRASVATTNTTRTRTKKIKPRRRASLANTRSHEQGPSATNMEQQRRPPKRTSSLVDISKTTPIGVDKQLRKASSEKNRPAERSRERLKPSFSTMSWGDPSFEPHKLESDTNFVSTYKKDQTKVCDSPVPSESSTSWGDITCDEETPIFDTCPDQDKTNLTASPRQRQHGKSLASTPWGELSLSTLASPADAQELSRSVLASLEGPNNQMSDAKKNQPRRGRRPKLTNAPSEPEHISAQPSSPDEASTLLSPYCIATQIRNDESDSSESA